MGAVSERAKQNRKAYLSDYYFRNKERYSALSRARYIKNREKILERNARTQRPYLLKKLYGLTEEQYANMLHAQGGACKICGKTKPSEDGRRKFLCVDHCHNTGRVRGLLCVGCNSLLGHYEKKKDAIAKYLGEGA